MSCVKNAPNILTKEELLDRLLAAHDVYYDTARDVVFAGRQFPGYAEFHTHGEKFVLSKKAKLWEVNAHEYLFFVTTELLDESLFKELVSFMTTEALAKIELVPDHMTSYLTLVVIADEVSEPVLRLVRTTRFRKNFLLGFRGWADLRLAVIDLQDNNVVTNGQGKEIKESLQANLRKALQAKEGNE